MFCPIFAEGNNSEISARARGKKKKLRLMHSSLAKVNKFPLLVAFVKEIQTLYQSQSLQKLGDADPS